MSSAIPTTPDPDAQLCADIDRSLRHPVMYFLTSGAAWLVVAVFLGVISSAKVGTPGFLGGCAWLSYGRVFPAHVNALVYGWGMQAAFAVMLWLTARVSRKECTSVATVLTAGHVWNLGVALGIVGILSGNGTGMPWLEFPVFAWPLLLVSYLAITAGAFIQVRVRPAGRVPVAQWYILAALIWFPWIFITANTLLHCLPGHPVMGAAINAWYKSALLFLFFAPVAFGAAYALVTQVTGRHVFSDALAKLGFWSLAIIAPWAGMQRLAGAPLPYFLPYVGAAATALMFIPACAAVTNTIHTAWPDRATWTTSPALRFTIAGMIVVALLAVASVWLNLPDSTLTLTQFSLAGYGFDILAIYGFFSFVMFGAAYFIVPRVTNREWLSTRLVGIHFLFSIYGMVTILLVAIIGGLQQGMSQENWQQPWLRAAICATPFVAANTFAWGLLLFSNVCFLLHLALMWLGLGRHSTAPVLLARAHAEWPVANIPMSLRTFILSLAASFGAAWLAIIVIPFFKMRALAPVALVQATDGASGVFFPKRGGRIADGARVYAANGCYLCHTQMVRPTYAGNDLYRPDWGGLKSDADRGDTRRETNAYDFFGEKFAQLGVMRVGPDLSNIGRRVESLYAAGGDPAAWLYAHLYNPRDNPQLWQSTCPPHPFLFERHQIKGNPAADAVKVDADASHQWLPDADAKALVSYLLSLKKDQQVPAALNYAPKQTEGAP
jgi:cytochrome c oxidase cbb3-type subunit 1